MVEFNFKNSTYKFTDPIRYFKANDPYYWEVDNIPLKQLQENTLWLKDQIGGAGTFTITRAEIAELKPYVNGSDRLARVNPGRYTARINDAYSPEPMGYIDLVLGELLGEVDLYRIKTAQLGQGDENDALAIILDTFTSLMITNAKDMNGLAERAFTYPMQTEDSPSVFVSNTEPTSNLETAGKGPFPLSEVIQWAKKDANSDTAWYVDGETWTGSYGFNKLSFLESSLVKKWKGVTRTAIVDIPSELSITIPEFDTEEFFYTDTDGNKVVLPGVVQRIDLLFIYSKPIDASATVTGRYQANTPKKIITPELGIVKGAGIGIDLSIPVAGTGAGEGQTTPDSAVDSDGNPMILPNMNDALSTTNGFTGLPTQIHGSFPSPDDLMNIAPLLSKNLEAESYELVGQSILPVAYIVVRSTEDILPTESVIDIRPFFRTTELAYNERAGIAAANPQLSFANPVVGKALLDKVERGLKNHIDNSIAGIDPAGGGGGGEGYSGPRVAACGHIFGGAYFGPEAVLIHQEMNRIGHSDLQTAWSAIALKYGIPLASPPLYPDWDYATHATTLENYGQHINDYINISSNWSYAKEMPLSSPGFPYASLAGKADVDNFILNPASTTSRYNTNRMRSPGAVGSAGGATITFVSKTIRLNKPAWLDEYDVQVQFWNCVPMSQGSMLFPGGPADLPMMDFGGLEMARSSGIWIDKKPTEFTINVAFAAADWNSGADEDIGGTAFGSQQGTGNQDPTVYRDNERWSAFIVQPEDFTHDVHNEDPVGPGSSSPSEAQQFMGEPQSGCCSVPTVTFQVLGYPAGYNKHYDLNGLNPQIDLT